MADEPTTALDATEQVQIVILLRSLQREGMGMIFVTHAIHAANGVSFTVPPGEVLCILGAVVSALGGASEMALLAQLGTLIGQLPADPLSDIVFAARVLRIELSSLFGEIHHDRPGF